MADNIVEIHRNKKAIFGKKYYDKDNKTYVGLKNGRLELQLTPDPDLYPTTSILESAIEGSNKLISGDFNVNFGEGSSHEEVDIIQPKINDSNFVVFTPTIRQEDFAVEGITITLIKITPGVGFSVAITASNGTSGIYSIKYTII